MAFMGVANPLIALLNTDDGTYRDGFKCGSSVSTNVTPNYAEGTNYGDNKAVTYKRKFTNASLSMTVTELPAASATIMFGHAIDAASGEVKYSSTDNPPYVGYGYVVDKETDAGESLFEANFLPKVRFAEDGIEMQTRGDSITFNNPALSGAAVEDTRGNWRYSKDFKTALAGEVWVKNKLNMEVQYQEVTPVGTENPSIMPWYTRTGTEGAYVYTLSEDTEVQSGTTYYEVVVE